MKIRSFLFVASISFIAGCSAWNSAQSDKLQTDVASSWRVTRLNMFIKKDGFVVQGKIIPGLNAPFSAGHVDVKIYAADGAVLANKAAEYWPYAPRRTGHHAGAQFTAYFDFPHPDDSTVKVTFHEGPITDKETRAIRES